MPHPLFLVSLDRFVLDGGGEGRNKRKKGSKLEEGKEKRKKKKKRAASLPTVDYGTLLEYSSASYRHCNSTVCTLWYVLYCAHAYTQLCGGSSPNQLSSPTPNHINLIHPSIHFHVLFMCFNSTYYSTITIITITAGASVCRVS